MDPFADPGVPASCSNTQLRATPRSDDAVALEGTFDRASDDPPEGGGGGVTGAPGGGAETGPPEGGGVTGVPGLGGLPGVLEPAGLLPVAAKDPAVGEPDPQANARLESAATDAMANGRVNA